MGIEVSHIAILLFAATLVGLGAAAEISLAVLNRARLRELVDAGDRRAAIIAKLLGDSTTFLITTMMLKTLGILVMGMALSRILSDSVGAFTLIGTTLALWLIATLLQTVFRASIQANAEVIARRLAPLMQFLYQLLKPVSVLLQQFGRSSGEGPTELLEESVFLTEDGLRLLMNVREEEEAIQESEKQMIASILDMEETVVREVMVPRIDMVALNVETTLLEALDVIIEAGHSRIPVFEGNIDRILGFLYAKDLLKCYQENRSDRPIREMLRPAYFVPDSKKLNKLFKDMQKQRVHIAIVVDEYGGTAGLVTIEDILEEIVGDIQDEYDVEEDVYVQVIAPNIYQLNSRLDLDTLSDILGTEIPDEDADTLGGLLYSLLGHVPIPGETVECEGWLFTVLTVDGRRIEQVRAESVAPPASGHEDEFADEDAEEVSDRDSVLRFLTSD